MCSLHVRIIIKVYMSWFSQTHLVEDPEELKALMTFPKAWNIQPECNGGMLSKLGNLQHLLKVWEERMANFIYFG